tara:strand:- start:1406 stop:2182 length:777 start_codon:yes stop_codon:yes gene_type:complete
MQLIPRYLVNNRTTVLVNETGLITEYRPVYTKQIQLSRGIDNALQFKLLNADQKAISLTGKTAQFTAFDQDKNMIIQRNGTAHGTITGLFTISITESDLLNLQDQFITYGIVLIDDSTSARTLTYSDTHFVNNGSMQIVSDIFPDAKASKAITAFTETGIGTGVYASTVISAEPGINGNEALHTAAIYTSSYIGTVTVQATLDDAITDSTTWADIDTLTFTGSETQPTPVNFTGVLGNVRFKTSANPTDKISKILVRN